MVRQANLYFPENRENELIKDRIAANTAAFAKALRNFLRGPTNDETLRGELRRAGASGARPHAGAGVAPEQPSRRRRLRAGVGAEARRVGAEGGAGAAAGARSTAGGGGGYVGGRPS